MFHDPSVIRLGTPILGPARMVLGARQIGLLEGKSTPEVQLAILEARVDVHDRLLIDLARRVTWLYRPWWHRWWTRLSGWWRTVATHR